MKIVIVGGGNLGGAIALGLAASDLFAPKDITVINRRQAKADELKERSKELNAVVNDYAPMIEADIVLLAIKPWMIEGFVCEHSGLLSNPKQILISVAAGVTLSQLSSWLPSVKPLFCVMPNTAIAVGESMTFIASVNATTDENKLVSDIFSKLGKVQMIDEKLMPAVMSLASCGIAYAFRYIRAAMEGGVEIGVPADNAKDIVLQTLRGAISLLEENGTHPEEEIDRVTTPGGITIKGLNEMEHAGFTSAVIKGLKASSCK